VVGGGPIQCQQMRPGMVVAHKASCGQVAQVAVSHEAGRSEGGPSGR
jgi:hypothetical protein